MKNTPKKKGLAPFTGTVVLVMRLMIRHSFFFILTALFFVSAPQLAAGSRGESVDLPASEVMIKMGVRPDGTPSAIWLDALREKRSPQEIAELRKNSVLMSKVELDWLRAFEEYLPDWAQNLNKLSTPFDRELIPPVTTIVLGNQGGLNLGFTSARSVIAVDISKWAATHGAPKEKKHSHSLLNEFLSEQYLRLLTSNHGADRFLLQTPLERGLWDLYLESVARHRFIDRKFLPYRGRTPQISKDALNKLTPLLAENLNKLRNADRNDELTIRSSVKAEKFEENWGVFPVAFWLAIETNSDDKKLQSFINEGPAGMLQLIKKHIGQDLKPRIEKLIQMSRQKKSS